MTQLWTWQRAMDFAKFAHHGQVDKSGRDYFEAHVIDVWQRTIRAGGTEAQEIVALLHDAGEDWPGGRQSVMMALMNLDLPPSILRSVSIINQVPNFSRDEYYSLIKTDADALFVKFRDHESNTDPERVATLRAKDPETADRLERKYAIMMERLTS